jgi:hypothetical protein
VLALLNARGQLISLELHHDCLSFSPHHTGAPYVSLLAQATWTIVLLLLPGSSYFSLLSYFGPSSWFYYALTGTSLFILPSEPKDQSWLTLCPPLFLIGISSILVVDSFINSPLYCSIAFGFILLSLPVWWLCHRWGLIDLSEGIGIMDYERQRCDEEGIEVSETSRSELSDESNSFLIDSSSAHTIDD